MASKTMKIWEDRKALKKYQERLEREPKQYRQQVQAVSDGGRKSRALCLGECALQAMEKINGILARPGIKILRGSLYYNIHEDRVKDETGEKGYRYTVTYNVTTNEPAWTKEQIREKVKDAQEKMRAETEEMYGTFSARARERIRAAWYRIRGKELDDSFYPDEEEE